ncbi:MAG TPA: HD domain-containing phosphohydrolase [Dissulfurispiraceae bacterium]
MNNTVLFVDDEAHILSSISRLFADSSISAITVSNAAEALEALASGEVSVIVSDNMMPGITGIELLQQAKAVSPESVRILITGHADLQSAVDAINKGEVYRFLTKPWDDEEFKSIVLNALDRHKIILSLKRADEATLLSLAQAIELKDPYTRGHCDRVARYAVRIAEALGLTKEEQEYVKYGSWLHDCGKIGVPESILNHKGPLSPEQMEIVRNHSRWGADIVRLAQLPDAVINIILYHHERFDGKGYPSGLKGKGIPLEARIATVADVYDALTSDRPYRSKVSHEKAKEFILSFSGQFFDPEIVETFVRLFG